MIYDEVQLSPAGDRYVLVSLGDDASMEVNFLTQAFSKELSRSIKSITDIIPSYNSILVQYDFTQCSYNKLCHQLSELYASLPQISALEIPSRLATIPVHYLDPWTKECIEEYRQKIAQREYDPEFVARVNGLGSAEDVIKRHSSTQHWVVTVSSLPGLPLLRPLNRNCSLVCPKYTTPRTWTPVGAVGVGGTSTAIYTIRNPGGYNLIGRTPTPVWEPTQRSPSFQESAILLRPSDRVQFRPVDLNEYREIEEMVAEGAYVHDIQPGVLSVREYVAAEGKQQ